MVTTIIPRNQALVATPYSMFNPPPLVPGTDGVAVPKENTTAVLCIAPGAATTYNELWGQELTLHAGDPHLALSSDDTYPNQIFHRDYSVLTGLDSDHELARVLVEFWQSRGFELGSLRQAWFDYLDQLTKPMKWSSLVRSELAAGRAFFLARKEEPVQVLGVVDTRLMTSEGPTQVRHGSVLVRHPDDPTNVWLQDAKVFARRYVWIKDPASGLLIPETN